MSETAVPATSVPASATSTSAPAASPATRAQLMAAIKHPTISSPTAPKTEAPAPVEGAVRYETGAGPVTEADGKGGEAVSTEPDAETIEAAPAADELIDYAAKYKELTESGDLHETFFEKMLLAKLDGQEMPITVNEALKGYMRRSDHSRAMNEFVQQRAALDAERAQISSMWGSFKDKPDLAVEVFTERFGDQWLDSVVAQRQAAQADYDNAVLGAGYRMIAQLGLDPNTAAQDQRVLAAMQTEKQRLDRARQLEIENKKLRRAQAELAAREQQGTAQKETESYQARFTATVKRFSDAALKSEGLTLNSVNRADLQKAVAQVIIARNVGASQPDYSVTQDVVREAASILKETRGTTPKSDEQPLPARQGIGTGTGAPVVERGKPKTRAEVMAALRGQ